MVRVELDHEIAGPADGEPVILLHGFPLDRSMWREQAKHLSAKGLRVILPDLRGHGKSPIGHEPATMARHVDDVLELADELRVEKFRLGGFSLGGYAALELVRTHPERVQSLLLIDTRAEPDSEEARAKRTATIAKIEEDGVGVLAETMIPQLFTEATRQRRPNIVDDVRRVILATKPPGAIDALRGMMDRRDQRLNLASIRAPTLIVVGAEDKLTPPDASRLMSEKIPNSQLRIVTGAAHLAPLEQPEPINHFLDHWITGFKDKPKVPSAFAGARG